MNTSVFGMILVDSMNVYQTCSGPEDIEDDPNEWFAALAHELIDNAVEEQRRRSSNTGRPRKVEAAPILLPSNKTRKGSTANWQKQGRCCIHSCPRKVTDLCSVCSDKRGKALFCCPPRSGRDCFEIHCQECH